MKLLWIFLIVLFAVPFVSSIDAYSITPLGRSIGINLSDVCETMLKNNFETSCPDFKTLLDLNLDTSNKKISGDFSFHNGMFQREKPIMVNHFRTYGFNEDFNIFVDPPRDMQDRIKMITIESNFQTYLLIEDMVKQNNTRSLHKDRWVDERCKIATISSDTWMKTLADTVNYMRNNCESGTTLETIYQIKDNSTNQNIETSFKYKHDNWEKQVKESHKVKKINNDNSTNKSVTEDKDPKYVPPIIPPFDYSKYR